MKVQKICISKMKMIAWESLCDLLKGLLEMCSLSQNVPWASYQICQIAGCACRCQYSQHQSWSWSCRGRGRSRGRGRECRKRFPRHRLQRKPLVSDPGMHHGTCVTHVPWCMSGSLTRGGGDNVPGTSSACATCDFTYLARSPWARNSQWEEWVQIHM